jgi:hypothetical protein
VTECVCCREEIEGKPVEVDGSLYCQICGFEYKNGRGVDQETGAGKQTENVDEPDRGWKERVTG